MVEINPMAIDSNKNVLCMDAKFSFDDNGVYLVFLLFSLSDLSEFVVSVS